MSRLSQTNEPPVSEYRSKEKPKSTLEASAASSASASVTAVSRRLIPSWITRLGRGITLDLRARAPFYKSDWTDAWNYRVVPATALIFCAK
jgi:hypothetical protein